jgi:hypothetical protein
MYHYTTVAALLQGAAGKENHGSTEAKRRRCRETLINILAA